MVACAAADGLLELNNALAKAPTTTRSKDATWSKLAVASAAAMPGQCRTLDIEMRLSDVNTKTKLAVLLVCLLLDCHIHHKGTLRCCEHQA